MTASSTPEGAAGRALALAVGVVALEFAAAVQTFVSSTLLPFVARDLHATGHLALLVAGSTIGLFTALPLAGRVAATLGPARALSLGLAVYLAGSAVTATAPAAWVFAVGQFLSGLAGGLLAVSGVSAVIRHLGPALRVRVVAAASAMWIVPALVGPPVTLALEHAVGWRWALLLPVPVVLAGRLLVARTSGLADADEPADRRPLGRTLLVPVGVAGLVAGGASPVGLLVAVPGAILALAGAAGLLPRGTGRLTPGVPAALAAMLLFATGYFGADGLVTVLLTTGYGLSVARAAVVLGAAPLAWAVTSLALARLTHARGGTAVVAGGLALAAVGAAGLAAGGSFAVALAAWTVGGVGVGLAYPALYLRCTNGSGATSLATAVVTAEAFGGLLGRAVGGAEVSAAVAARLPAATGLTAAYAMYAAVLALAAVAALRAAR